METSRHNTRYCRSPAIALVLAITSRLLVAADQQPARQIDVEPTAPVTSGSAEDEFPALGHDADGRLWVAWLSYDGQQDRVLSRKFDSGVWSEPVALTERPGDYWKPAMAREDVRLWVIWSQNDEGNWDLWGRYLDQGRWSHPLQLTTHRGNDFAHQLAQDAGGRLWITWQAVRDSNYEVLLARVTPEGLVDERNISADPASDWEPAIASRRDGRVVVAWDSYRSGSYDILMRELRDGELTQIRSIASSPDYEAHAALAVDRQDRVWIAWDNGGSHWGQHGHATDRLHERRSVHLCCIDGDQLRKPIGWKNLLAGELAEFCELPQLTMDRDGRLWMIVRHLHDVTPLGTQPNGRPHQPRGIWNFYAFYYAGDRWTPAQILPDSNGRNDMCAASCVDDEGHVYVTWADDGRRLSRAEEPVNHNVHVARLSATGDTSTKSSTGLRLGPPFAQAEPTHHQVRYQEREPYQITVGGQPYQLLYGDTHRHTDISRCRMNFDGSLMDTYRYAIDASQLDFLAISDHDQDLLKHRYDKKQSPLLGYAWWRSQKYCDLFYIEQRFLPIYGYEHGGSYQRRGGHKNVLYAERGGPCLEVDSPSELFEELQGIECVVIPHQLADGGSATDWRRWDSAFERVAEIFQTRGSYEYLGAPRVAEIQREGHYLWDALDQRIRIGVVASSDHALVHGAYAAVYARNVTRRGVLEALRERRSFGATDTMVIDFRLQEQMLGQEVSIDEPPAFEITIRGTAPLQQVQVVKNGAFVYTTNPEASICQLRYTDVMLESGDSAYYYVRAGQQNNEWAWSSAIWVQR